MEKRENILTPAVVHVQSGLVAWNDTLILLNPVTVADDSLSEKIGLPNTRTIEAI